MRIMGGFVIVLIMMFMLAFIGYKSLSKSADYFVAYERMATLNVLFSDLLYDMESAKYRMSEFEDSYDANDVTAAKKASTAPSAGLSKYSPEQLLPSAKRLQPKPSQISRNTRSC